MQTTKIRSFKDLDTWKASHKLVVAIFKNSPKNFDVLWNQMQRSALSITSNIAEGFGRQTLQDKRHFYVMARGSGYELQNQLLVARDSGRLNKELYFELSDLGLNSRRLLQGLIRSLDNAGS